MSPENFSSIDLDELSGMTYLSYFLNVDAPGYNATLDWVKDVIQPAAVNNFDVSPLNIKLYSCLYSLLYQNFQKYTNKIQSHLKIIIKCVASLQNSPLVGRNESGIIPD